jgi:methylmalonyl-CoA mutase N-terminal domain/subunit
MTSGGENEVRKRWRQEMQASAAREQPATTVSGAPIEPLYTPEDLDDFDYASRLGYPGQYPFTRGVHASMYRGRLWTMRQFAGFGSPRQTNERFRFLLARQQTGLSTAFDLPTLMGLDSDDPRSLGEVGRLGVAVDTIDDMQQLFDGIDLAKVSVSMTINAPAIVVMAFFLENARQQGCDWRDLRGTIQNDISRSFTPRTNTSFPPNRRCGW